MTYKRLTREWAWDLAVRHLQCATDQAETPEDMIAISREYRLLAVILPASPRQKHGTNRDTDGTPPVPEGLRDE